MVAQIINQRILLLHTDCFYRNTVEAVSERTFVDDHNGMKAG